MGLLHSLHTTHPHQALSNFHLVNDILLDVILSVCVCVDGAVSVQIYPLPELHSSQSDCGRSGVCLAPSSRYQDNQCQVGKHEGGDSWAGSTAVGSGDIHHTGPLPPPALRHQCWWAHGSDRNWEVTVVLWEDWGIGLVIHVSSVYVIHHHQESSHLVSIRGKQQRDKVTVLEKNREEKTTKRNYGFLGYFPAEREKAKETKRMKEGAAKKAKQICVNRHAEPLLCSGGNFQEWENMALYNMEVWGLQTSLSLGPVFFAKGWRMEG